MEAINERFKKNIEALTSSNVEVVKNAIKDLGLSNDKRAIPILIDILSKRGDDDNIRNDLALSLGKLKANESVPLLIELAKKSELKNKRGSIIYALKDLDCREYFIEFVEMICNGNYEVCSHAFDIFESLVDEASYSEKLIAKEKLKNQEEKEIAMLPSKHPKYDRIHFIKDALRSLED